LCSAYPGGIPLGILAGEMDHRKPQKGDRGIQYEKGEPIERPKKK